MSNKKEGADKSVQKERDNHANPSNPLNDKKDESKNER